MSDIAVRNNLRYAGYHEASDPSVRRWNVVLCEGDYDATKSGSIVAVCETRGAAIERRSVLSTASVRIRAGSA
jgi:hypothetical protein